MRFVKVLAAGSILCLLTSCGVTSTKNMFGKQKKNGPNLAGSTKPLSVPGGLSNSKMQTFYPVGTNVPKSQPHVSLVPPGADLAKYHVKKK